MSETMERTDGIIDHEMLARWHAENLVAAEKLGAARLSLARAEEAHVAASHATGRAANTGDERDVLNAQLHLEEAERLLVVQRKIFERAAAAMTRSNGRRDLVRGLAHRGMFEDAVRQRVEAARRGDLAREALAAAEGAYRAGTAQMRLSFQNGVQDFHNPALDGHDLVKTEAAERRHWTDRGIDADSPKHPMIEPVVITDEEAHAQGLLRVSKGGDIIHISRATLGAHLALGWKEV